MNTVELSKWKLLLRNYYLPESSKLSVQAAKTYIRTLRPVPGAVNHGHLLNGSVCC